MGVDGHCPYSAPLGTDRRVLRTCVAYVTRTNAAGFPSYPPSDGPLPSQTEHRRRRERPLAVTDLG